MPNRYFVRPMTDTEYHRAKVAADLGDGEFQKLTGRHRLDVVQITNGSIAPRHLEAVMLEYLAAHPDRKADLLAIAEARITGFQKDEGRAARRAHLQPKT